MRQNITVVLLGLCCALLGANLVATWRAPANVVPGGVLPYAFGQSGGSVIMAGANTQNEPHCFIYDAGRKRLVCYGVKGKGLELKGVRSLEFDFEPIEFPDGRGPTAVKNMKKIIGQAK